MHQGSLTLCKHPRSDEVEAAARQYLGTPWKPGARSKHGLDCIGFIIRIAFDIGLYKEGSIEVPKYRQVPDGNMMLKHFQKYLKQTPRPMHGGVVTIAQIGTGLYHVGVIGQQRFYHASAPDHRVVEQTLVPEVIKDRRACFVFERPDE